VADRGGCKAVSLRARVRSFVDLALAADRQVDRLFWLPTVADEIRCPITLPGG
jgi:hypothetical protein